MLMTGLWEELFLYLLIGCGISLVVIAVAELMFNGDDE